MREAIALLTINDSLDESNDVSQWFMQTECCPSTVPTTGIFGNRDNRLYKCFKDLNEMFQEH